MMQRISGAVYNWSFSDQFISESTNQRINETGNVHESRHCGMLKAAIQRFWVVGRGSSIRLFVYSRFLFRKSLFANAFAHCEQYWYIFFVE